MKAKQILIITALTFLLLIPIFCALVLAIDLEYSWLKKIAYFVVVLTLLAIPALFLKARTYFLVEGIFNFLFFPIDIASLYLNHQSTSRVFLKNIYATNPSEALELLGAMWYMVCIVVVLWVVYFWLVSRVENRHLLPRKATKGILIFAGTIFILGLLGMMAYTYRGSTNKSFKFVVVKSIDLVWTKLYKIYPYNLYIETYEILKNKHQQSQLNKQVESYTFGISPSPYEQPELYIYVIGETARYDHFGLNGYARNTTPRLETIPNIISFDSVFSQGNLTETSVPLLVSRATADNPNRAYTEKIISEAFQEAGFEAGWILKQRPYLMMERAMANADYAYSWPKELDVDNNFDIDIVAKLHEFIADTTQFFVIHSAGSHFRYELRYPKEFEQFQPVLGKTFSYLLLTEENKDKLMNAYDNSILYTDYFLSELIHYADSLNRPATILYISDHGENFWDDERKLLLHGSYQISEYEYHVPLLIWYSDEYRDKYPHKVQQLQNNRRVPVSSDVVFYSLLDLANIAVDMNPTHSLCSPELLPQDTIFVITGSGAVERHAFKHHADSDTQY